MDETTSWKMDILIDKSRYSRADLLALRYEGNARQRPNCANRTELQTLNFWKINGFSSNLGNVNNSNSNNYGNKSCSSPERENSSLTTSNGLLSSRRALRNRERAHNYYQRFSSNDQIGGDDPQVGSVGLNTGNLSTSYKASNIDHRSISSSHLMPAFAKRRFIIENNETQNEKINAVSNYEDSLPNLKEKSSTPAQGNANTDPKSHMRSTISSLGSPKYNSNESTEWNREWEKRSDPHDIEQSTALSPTFLSSRHGGSLNVQERRIGSGRLLPRTDNWEYKNQDPESTIKNTEIDRPQNGSITNQQRQRTFSGKHSERLNDSVTERDRERRLNERRGADCREPNDGKKNVQVGRRTSSKDKFHFGDLGNQNRGKRANLYQMHDRHEPEWFSAGPTSQHETIDLHGFDDLDDEGPVDLKFDNIDDSSKEFSVKANQVGSTTSRSSSVVSLNIIESNSNKKESEETNGPKQNNSVNSLSKSEVEFNFDAFLNMDPMDHSLMGNNNEVKGEMTGTSRFSRWFAPKESTNNNDIILFRDSTLDTQEIPSVKDLEAQMTKVDLRPEYTVINAMTNAHESIHTETQAEKPVTRDTEAFKRLLQQLGAQNNSQVGHEPYHLSNVSTVRDAHRLNGHDRLQNLGRIQEPQIKEDDMQLYQQRAKRNQIVPHRNNEPISQTHLQHALRPCAHDPNASGLLPMQTQKRVEIQHLLQSIARGDVSVEFLEKEINNPNTSVQSREIIASVLYECSNIGRLNHDLNHHNTIKNQVFNKNVGSNASEDLFPQNTSSEGQHIRHSNSPTPLAFTPTSVLRKMTADRETTLSHSNSSAINQQYHQYQLPTQHGKPIVHNMMNADSSVISAGINLQPRMILGGNYAANMQHQLNVNSPQISPKLLPQMSQSRGHQIKWPPGNVQASHGSKAFGRPILKGTLNSCSQQITPLAFASNIDFHQVHHQRLKAMPPNENINNDSIHGGLASLQNVPYNDGISQMQHHYLQHQQPQRPQPRHRLMIADIHRQTNIPMQATVPMGAGTDDAETVNLMKCNNLGPTNFHRDGRLSPTTNQLAQWFSPELLARASAGKLPLLNMNQTLSLEEFERRIQHSSANVLN